MLIISTLPLEAAISLLKYVRGSVDNLPCALPPRANYNSILWDKLYQHHP